MPTPNTVKYWTLSSVFQTPFLPKAAPPPNAPLQLTVGPHCCQIDWATVQLPLPGQARSLVGLIMLLYCMIYDSINVADAHRQTFGHTLIV